MNLNLLDPVVAYLLDRMLVYAQGNEFCPHMMIRIEELSELVDTVSNRQETESYRKFFCKVE